MSTVNPGIAYSPVFFQREGIQPHCHQVRGYDQPPINPWQDTVYIQPEITLEQSADQMTGYLRSMPPERKRFFKDMFMNARAQAWQDGKPEVVAMSQAILNNPYTSPEEKQLAKDFLVAGNRRFGTHFATEPQDVQQGQSLTPEDKTVEDADKEMQEYLQNLPEERKRILRPIFKQAAARAKANKLPLAVEISKALLMSPQTNEEEKQLALNFLHANHKQFHSGNKAA
ncbi:MAG: hypothetical protein HYU64_08645 [Armatimonadetes bacterium]|nr:hypothetical protein [Armatimonadota bacterium]